MAYVRKIYSAVVTIELLHTLRVRSRWRAHQLVDNRQKVVSSILRVPTRNFKKSYLDSDR
jgi:hypothetical protein